MAIRTTPFVGRLPELGALVEDLERACAGAGAVRFICGEPGIGKTRLADELAQNAHDLGCTVLRGWAAEHETDRPFGVLLDALRSGPDELFSAAKFSAAAPFEHSAVDGLVDVIETATSHRPLVLMLEDLHWADQPTTRFLLSVGLRAAALPLLIVTTMRPVPRSPSLERVTAKLVDQGARLVELDGLDVAHVADLARCLLGEPPAASLSDYLRGAGGNPLFVTELIAALSAQHSLTSDAEGIGAVTLGLPPPLRLTILRRLDHLSSALIELLRVAAVLGASFSVRDLSTVSGRASAELLPLLDEALRAGVIVDRLDRLAFRHDVLHESIYQDLPLSARQALHREFADLLAAEGADALAVAEHMSLGAVPGDSRAVQWLVEAADQCPEASGGELSLLERARSLCAHDADELPAILARLALSYVFMGRLDHGSAAAHEALRSATSPAVAAQAHEALAVCKIVAGRFAEGVEEMLAIAATDEYPLSDRAELLATAAYFSVLSMDPVRAIERANAALEMIPPGTMPSAECYAVQALALATMATGNATDALSLANKARTFELPYQGSAGVTFALVSMLCNDLDSAGDAIRDDLLALAGGNEGTRPILHFSMAMVHYLGGDLDAAAAEAAAGQTLSDELETGVARSFGQAIAALIAIHRDDLAGAAAVLGQAVQELEQFGPQFGVDLLLLAQALHAEATGDQEMARVWLQGPWDLAGPMRAMSMGQLLAPELLHSLLPDDVVTASRVVEELEELAVRNPAPVPVGIAKLGRAMIDRDGDLALRAVEIHGQTRAVIPHARVCELAAEVLIETGRKEDAARLLGGALDIWEATDACRDEARVAALLRSVGVRRRRPTTPRRERTGWDALTATELKVAELVADGLTSKEVGSRLFISRRTVETHLAHIFAKLGVSNRSQVAAAFASR